MEHKISPMKNRKRAKIVDDEFLVKSKEDSTDSIKKENQLPKTYLFVWLAANIKENKRLQASTKQLECILPCALATNNSDECKRWLMKYDGNKNIFLIVSNQLSKQIIYDVHSLPCIVGIYVYGMHRQVHNKWTFEDYHKVCENIPNMNKLVERVSKDFEDMKCSEDAPLESVHKKTKINDIELCCADQVEEEKKASKKDGIESSQFVLIDVSKHLNQRSAAMLKTLIVMVKTAIYVFDGDDSTINYDQLPDKPAFLFVSSAVADKMKHQPKQTKSIFILEEDQNKVNHRDRFENDEDLIFELGDEIYRCYKKEANEYLLSGNKMMAEIKEEQANQVHNHLKKAYKSVSDGNHVKQESN